MTIKEMVIKQFNYCNAIATDIIANNKSKEVQEYAKQYAEIESPLVGGTNADWIRINWGDIYIFLHDNGSIEYQLDPIGEYGGELIDVYGSLAEFIQEIDLLDEDKIQDKFNYWIECIPEERIPLRDYVSMAQ